MTPRTLILCFDGTRNEYDGDNTNVVKLISMLEKDDAQLVYYQPGIGTYTDPSIMQPIFKWFAEVLDQAVAWYLDAHVMSGYKFLMQNYMPGDKICIFGFSRGAYTARAVAGMLDRVGLLGKDNLEQVPFAFEMYSDEKKANLCAGFKRTFSTSVTVDFLGVWDTVASVGLYPKTLPFTSVDSASSVRVFRHALSLDERRTKFQPTFFQRPAPNTKYPNGDSYPPRPFSPATKATSHGKYFAANGTPNSNGGTSYCPYFDDNDDVERGLHRPLVPEGKTDVLEVWFVGNHGDVGGGNTTDEATHSLANIPLNWMIRQAVEAQCGIRKNTYAKSSPGPEADAHSLPSFPSFPVPGGRSSPYESSDVSRKSVDVVPEQVRREAQVDVMQKIKDHLGSPSAWWLLEVIPTKYSWQDDSGAWCKKWSFHNGSGRIVPMDHPKFHWTVKWRMENVALKYKPRAKYVRGSETYVW